MDFNQYVGIPWTLGGSEPVEGLDCWSLCRYVLARHFGIEMHLLQGIAVPIGERADQFEAVTGYTDWSLIDGTLLPGDVVFFHSKSTGRPHHVGLHIGNNKVLHSMEQGARGAQIQRLGLLKPYFGKFTYYRHKKCH